MLSLIGFTDNFVRVIAAEAGLWQFHALHARSWRWAILALVGLMVAAAPATATEEPAGGGAARSAIHGSGDGDLFRRAGLPAGGAGGGGAVHGADLRPC
jgi:hypothetical protein